MDSATSKTPAGLVELTDTELAMVAGGIVFVPPFQPGYGNNTASTFGNGQAGVFHASTRSNTTQVIPGLGRVTASHVMDP